MPLHDERIPERLHRFVRKLLNDERFSEGCSRGKGLLLGNEAIARGAMEGGVQIAAAYPGTPSTEILECIYAHVGSCPCFSTNNPFRYKTTRKRFRKKKIMFNA